MLEVALLLAFCILVGLSAVAVCVYLAITGSLLSEDGLALAFIALTIGAIFMANVAWSAYTGELKAVFNHFRKPRAEQTARGAVPAESSKESAQ